MNSYLADKGEWSNGEGSEVGGGVDGDHYLVFLKSEMALCGVRSKLRLLK